MSKLLRSAVAATGFPALMRGLFAREGVFFLELHGVAGRRYAEVPTAAQPSFTAEDLEAALRWLSKRFAFLTPDQAFLPGARGVLLTFDDGFANNFTRALPLLERFGVPAVFFVTLQHVEEPSDWLPSVRRALAGIEPAWPEEVRQDLFDGMSVEQLRAAAAHPLITIGSHTLGHPRLTACDGEVLRRQVESSRQRLSELTGREVDLFAYPYGDYDRRVAEAVRSAGYRAAFAEDARQAGLPDFEIPRVGLYSAASSYLDLKLSGLYRRPWRQAAEAGT